KNVAKNVEWIMETATAAAHATGKSGMAVTIIGGALVGIAEDVIRLANFLEFFLGSFVARVLVRVKLNSELAIRLFQIFSRNVLADAQHFVVIAFRGHE